MSNTNSLRTALAAAQDDPVFPAEDRPGHRLPYALTPPTVQPRPSGFKSIDDRERLARATITSDLRGKFTPVLIDLDRALIGYGIFDSVQDEVGTRSSETGIRQREAAAQVQCSRTFNADEDALQDAEGLVYEDCGRTLSEEVALQERDFGPERDPEDEDEDEANLQARRKALGFCPDCGEPGERRGHQECQYPSND